MENDPNLQQPVSQPFTLDLEKNSLSLSISKEIYLRILSKAVRQTEKDIDDLDACLVQEDFKTVQAISHRLKGDFDNMRIVALSSLAAQMNEMAKSNQDVQKMQKHLHAFKIYFRQLQNFMAGQTRL
jgi:HPt (histidine-containing phosphotransfer) domain-containing protein